MEHNTFKLKLTEDGSYRCDFILAILIPVAVLAGGVIIAINSEFFSHLFPPCMIKGMTGMNCLSCGATRSTIALLNGHLLTSVYYNPLYFAFLCWLVYLYSRLVISLVRKPYKKYCLHITAPWGIAVIVTIIAFALIRNTDFYQAVFF